ncbi:MAG: GldG family protein [Methylophilaceae bacterium]
MKINKKLRLQMMMQNSMFVVLFLALVLLIGYVTNEFHVSRDITQSSRNTLSEGSINLLKQMKGAVNVTVYAGADDTRRKVIVDFVTRYQRAKPDLHIEFVNPAANPKQAQEAGIRDDGEFVVEYNKKTEHVLPPINEQDMANALVKLSRSESRNVMFLEGHGERSLIGLKEHDLGDFGKELESRGFKLSNPNLVLEAGVPKQGAMLVIASPQIDVSPVEVAKIKTYIAHGGNVLWLLEQGSLHGLEPLADQLGLQLTPGIVVDPAAAQAGGDFKMAFSARYAEHPITLRFNLRSIFPLAREIASNASDMGFDVTPLIDVAATGWLETGDLAGKIAFDAKQDKGGPINIAIAMERKFPDTQEAKGKTQRIVVVGSGGFLSNRALSSVGNFDLGVNMVNWLSGDDKLITIQPRPFKDTNLNIPADKALTNWLVIRGIPTYLLPFLLLMAGLLIWVKRRKR